MPLFCLTNISLTQLYILIQSQRCQYKQPHTYPHPKMNALCDLVLGNINQRLLLRYIEDGMPYFI